jgi:hypothetical protein
MIFKQYYLGCLAHASYLIGDEDSRTAAVVDPQRDVDQYLEDAKGMGFRFATFCFPISMPTSWPGILNSGTAPGHKFIWVHALRPITRSRR